MQYEEASTILEAMCAVQEDKTKIWHVKMPQFEQLGDTSLVAPELCLLDENESDLNEHMLEPIDPEVCLPDQDEPDYWGEALMSASMEDQDPP